MPNMWVKVLIFPTFVFGTLYFKKNSLAADNCRSKQIYTIYKDVSPALFFVPKLF